MKPQIGILLTLLFLTGCAPLAVSGHIPEGVAVASPTPAALLGRYTTALPDPTQPQRQQPDATTVTVLHATATSQAEQQTLSRDEPTATAPPTAAPTISPLEGFQICSPLAEILLEDLPRLISDGYHPPPSTHSDARHVGIDIAFYNWKGHRQIAGHPIQAVLAGRVAVAEEGTFPFGSLVIVETQAQQLPAELKQKLGIGAEQSLYLLYAHMQEDSLRVELGAEVTACQTLGRVGKTGNSGAAHLHLENRIGPAGMQFTGFQYYIRDASQQEKENYSTWATSGTYRHFEPLRLLLYEFGYEPTPVIKSRKDN